MADSERVTLEEVQRLRKEWHELQASVIDGRDRHAQFADGQGLDATRDRGGASNWTAAIVAVETEERTKSLEYQDALARYQHQEASRQVEASEGLSKTNTRLTYAIAFAALVQAGAAIAQAIYAAKAVH